MADNKNSSSFAIRHRSSLLYPVTASEIEFYLHGSDSFPDMEGFWAVVRAVCEAVDIEIFNIEKERGREQHEVSLCPSTPERTVADTIALKEIITQVAAKREMIADFSAKPFADDFGSGLHIHLHLEDKSFDMGGKNLFYKDDERMSDELSHSIAGLLANMADDMAVFAPSEASKARFVAGMNAPTTISWGANNRTTALRLPDSPKTHKRIEHRVAGADADIEQVMERILNAVKFGLKRELTPPEQIFGDASLPMYNLPRLIANLET